MNGRSIAAIVAAFNEEKTIGPIIKTLVDTGIFRDIIVISDGSSDRTSEIARQNGASLVHQFPINRGKGRAVLHGVGHTDASILFFCDADLKGLTVEHVKNIVEPVVRGDLAMNVGIRDRGALMMKITPHLPLIGGERSLSRNLFEKIPEKYLNGFMLETSLNYACSVHGMRIGTTEMPGLTMRKKMQKVGFWRGLMQYIGMGFQIAAAAIAVRIGRLKGDF